MNGLKSNRYSDLKIFGYPEKIRSFQEGRLTAPIYVRIKPTNRCNHGCRWCCYSDGTIRPRDTGADDHLQSKMHETMREHDEMPPEKAADLIDDLAAMGVKAVTFSGGGEPLLYSGICMLLERCLQLGLKYSAITNGHLLTGDRGSLLSMASWVRVSIDYATPGQIERSRNIAASSFDRILANLRQFSKLAALNACALGVNFIVTRENCDWLCAAAQQLKMAGVENVRFSPVYVAGFREYHEPIRQHVEAQLALVQRLCDDRFSVNSTYDIDSPSKQTSRPFKLCRYLETVPVVGADLNVYACHNTAYSEHGLLGSIKDRKFSEMWFAPETRVKMLALDPSRVCNHECANHSKVDLFNRLAESSSDPFV